MDFTERPTLRRGEFPNLPLFLVLVAPLEDGVFLSLLELLLVRLRVRVGCH